ncbi:MAG: hypothetical protein SGILL_000425 [Bacillariaceae sp.]
MDNVGIVAEEVGLAADTDTSIEAESTAADVPVTPTRNARRSVAFSPDLDWNIEDTKIHRREEWKRSVRKRKKEKKLHLFREDEVEGWIEQNVLNSSSHELVPPHEPHKPRRPRPYQSWWDHANTDTIYILLRFAKVVTLINCREDLKVAYLILANQSNHPFMISVAKDHPDFLHSLRRILIAHGIDYTPESNWESHPIFKLVKELELFSVSVEADMLSVPQTIKVDLLKIHHIFFAKYPQLMRNTIGLLEWIREKVRVIESSSQASLFGDEDISVPDVFVPSQLDHPYNGGRRYRQKLAKTVAARSDLSNSVKMAYFLLAGGGYDLHEILYHAAVDSEFLDFATELFRDLGKPPYVRDKEADGNNSPFGLCRQMHNFRMGACRSLPESMTREAIRSRLLKLCHEFSTKLPDAWSDGVLLLCWGEAHKKHLERKARKAKLAKKEEKKKKSRQGSDNNGNEGKAHNAKTVKKKMKKSRPKPLATRTLDAPENRGQERDRKPASVYKPAFRSLFRKKRKASGYWEVDTKSVLNYKKKEMKSFSKSMDVKPLCPSYSIPMDLSKDSVAEAFSSLKQFQSSTPTCWIVEGLIMYLERAKVVKLMDDIASSSALGSFLILNFSNNTPKGPSIDEIKDQLAEKHWKQASRLMFGDESFSFDRYPPNKPANKHLGMASFLKGV